MTKNKEKKDVYYFPHDYNPTSDPKILAFIGEYGAVGYGIYWRIVEMLHESQEHVLPLKKYIYSALAKQMLTDVEQVLKIVESCINDYELFDSDDEYFWCNRVLRNVEKIIELRAKKKKGGDASAEARKLKKQQEEILRNNQHNLTDVEHNLTRVEHNLTEGNKGKESKVKEIKEKESIVNTQNETSKNFDAKIKSDFERYEKTFFDEDLQNFIDHFKPVNITEQEIKNAMHDFRCNKLASENPDAPYAYRVYKEWFKKYLTDNRQKYVHIAKQRVIFIDENLTREDLRVSFKFYWHEEYTLEFIKEQILSGEFPPKDTVHFDRLLQNNLIKVQND